MARKRLSRARFLSPVFLITSSLWLLALLVAAFGARWTIAQLWPLLLVGAGLSGILSSLASKGRLATGYLVSSLAFLCLGAAFSQFSFRLAPMGLKAFVQSWWPALFVAGFICLASAWLYLNYRRTGTLRGAFRQAFHPRKGHSASRAGGRRHRSDGAGAPDREGQDTGRSGKP